MKNEYSHEEAEQLIMRVIALSDNKILELLQQIGIQFSDKSDVDIIYDIKHDPDMYQWILTETPKAKLLQKLKELESK
ncbi:MAG TPA: hypothetical protein VJH04_00200 [archaeon]|nr:hypothetical protein [archaeon]